MPTTPMPNPTPPQLIDNYSSSRRRSCRRAFPGDPAGWSWRSLHPPELPSGSSTHHSPFAKKPSLLPKQKATPTHLRSLGRKKHIAKGRSVAQVTQLAAAPHLPLSQRRKRKCSCSFPDCPACLNLCMLVSMLWYSSHLACATSSCKRSSPHGTSIMSCTALFRFASMTCVWNGP